MADPKIMIEVGTYLGNVKGTVDKCVQELERAQKEADRIDLTGTITKSIKDAVNEIQELEKKYSKTINDLAEGKLDSKKFENFTKEIESKMDEIVGRVGDV